MSEVAGSPQVGVLQSPPSDPPLLEVTDLRVQYRQRRRAIFAVNGVDLELRRGETVGVVGETGCGKSATVRAVLGLVAQPGRVSGQVRFEGSDLLAMRGKALRSIRGTGVGFIPQNPFTALNPVLTIGDQFFRAARAHALPSREEVRSRAWEILAALGIDQPGRVLDGFAHQLSGGMAQRVVAAISLSLAPRLIIADEPTTALDLRVQRQFLDLLTSFTRSHSMTVMMVTHDLGVVAQYCDRVMVMYGGKIVESGSVGEVMVQPAHPYTAALLASVPERGRRLVRLAGTVPILHAEPAGCVFAARCGWSGPGCEEAPPTRRLATNRSCACHRAEEVLERGSARDRPCDEDLHRT